jgi:DNA repair photolyase
MDEEYIKGRGAQIKTSNKFLKQQYVSDHVEGVDEYEVSRSQTQVFFESPKTIVNKVTSPDLGMMYSTNPYQGCEHGCVYCYARNTHEYWGFSAGLDFENKIIVKKEAPLLIEKFILNPNWEPVPISVSGNTDCYQPLEKEFLLTRGILKVFAKYRHPVGMITKNGLVTRDIDILQDLAKDNLVHVYISITTMDEDLRRRMEPRTATAAKRLKTIEDLARAGIPVGIMNAPVIPGLNHHEIPSILKAASEHGALTAGMSVVRLNGSIGKIFADWLKKNFPDRFDKVWNQICSLHGGTVNDSEFGRRMTGEGNHAEIIHQLFNTSRKKYFSGKRMPPIELNHFRRGGMLSLF